MLALYMLGAVDVRRASQAGSGRANLVAKVAIPTIKLLTADHNPGGGVGGVKWVLPRIEPPEPKYEAKGIDTDIFDGFGERDRWVFAGSWRNTKTGKLEPSRAIIEGAVTDWEPDEASPEDYLGCNHSFNEVTHYEFRLGGKELWYWDFFERELRVNGKDYFKEVRRTLGS